MSPSIASLSNDTFVVTWDSAWQDSSYDGVYGQIFGTQVISTKSSSSIRQSNSDTNEIISGAERRTTSIALTALSWVIGTVKGALGY